MTLWGIATVIAIVLMLLSAASESGAERLALAVNTLVGKPPVAVAQIPAQLTPSPETIKLGEDLRELTADRERLNARLAKLETMLDDVTGSIKRQAAPAGQSAAPTPAATTPPPVAAPATMASPSPVAEGAPEPDSVPLPRERVARLDSNEPDPAATLKTEIGIDLGGAATPDALKARWAGLKANLGPFLGPLQPVMVVREAKPNSPPYRLILAPLPSNNAAVQVCARLATLRAFCRPANFTSQEAAQL
ncbi:MAG: hypothetical protein JO205_05520 [Pseudolabrys sp.]|nr:hypothetical protein [Pseudolabrys sp.]